MQVEERGARGAERETGRQALQAARDEKPGDRVGEHEQHARGKQGAECNEQDRAPPDLVGNAAGQEERREHAEGVGRIDEREDDRREAP